MPASFAWGDYEVKRLLSRNKEIYRFSGMCPECKRRKVLKREGFNFILYCDCTSAGTRIIISEEDLRGMENLLEELFGSSQSLFMPPLPPLPPNNGMQPTPESGQTEQSNKAE